MANRDKGLSRLAEPRHVNAIETRSKRAPRGNLNGASSEASVMVEKRRGRVSNTWFASETRSVWRIGIKCDKMEVCMM